MRFGSTPRRPFGSSTVRTKKVRIVALQLIRIPGTGNSYTKSDFYCKIVP